MRFVLFVRLTILTLMSLIQQGRRNKNKCIFTFFVFSPCFKSFAFRIFVWYLTKMVCSICSERGGNNSAISFHSDFQVDKVIDRRTLTRTAIPTQNLRRVVKPHKLFNPVQQFAFNRTTQQNPSAVNNPLVEVHSAIHDNVVNTSEERTYSSKNQQNLDVPNFAGESKVAQEVSCTPTVHAIQSGLFDLNCKPNCVNSNTKSCVTTAKRRLFDKPQPTIKKTQTRRIWNPRYIGDVKLEHLQTPRRRKRYWEAAVSKIKEQKNEVRVLKQKNKRLNERVKSLKGLLSHLKNKKLISEETENTLMDMSSDTLQELLNRRLKKNKDPKYPAAIRAFALTLQCYSSKAYSYVRKKFKNVLPHPATLRKWYTVVNASPGFTKESFDVIHRKILQGKDIVCNLVLDEMAIRQQVEWDGHKYHGFVDLGTNYYDTSVESDHLPQAKNALVFMAVTLNGRWKVPLGYFLISNLTAAERANLLLHCLGLCHEHHIKVYSITFDGAPVNISMCSTLGASFSYNVNFKPFILHPITQEKIFIFWDACHMLKLVRNTFGDKKILIDSAGNKIQWEHVAQLQKLQEQEGLRAATKIGKRHINFHNEKMNVRLAAQTLSSSVASALLFCEEALNLPQFKDAAATSHFCQIINNIFDILNSRNVFSKRIYNKCISSDTIESYSKYIKKCIEYLASLKDENGVLLLHSRRKTGFLGLIICLKNLLEMYEYVISKTSMKYLLSYKLSQDHLEIFFSAVRGCGGFNNNPSCLQFLRIYKRLIIRHEISGADTGNCRALEDIPILNVTSAKTSVAKVDCLVESEDAVENDNVLLDHSYYSRLNLTLYVKDVVSYIAGFVTRAVIKKISCTVCLKELICTHSNSYLLNIKNRGGLIKPSNDVCSIAMETENVCREYERVLFSRNIRNIKMYLLCKVKRNLKPDCFVSNNMIEHDLSRLFLDDHRNQLIDIIILTYLKVRLPFYGKVYSEKPTKVRTLFNHMVLFKNE